MKSFKQYLTEAKKKVTREQAQEFLNQIKRAIHPDMMQNLGSYGDAFEISFRAYDFFTERPGEEDDDHPDFTGDKRLNKILKPILKGVDFSFWPEEKSWITISLKAKPLTKKQITADKKKKIEAVRDAVRQAYFKTSDRWEMKFYDEFKEILVKWKKKFITKEDFLKLGNDDEEAALEAWYLAK